MSQPESTGVLVQFKTGRVDHHPTGVSFTVVDSHLYVRDRSDNIAIYAPGTWTRAKLGAASTTWE